MLTSLQREIPCIVFFSMPSILKNTKLAERYLELVKGRFSEPVNEKILGSFITEVFPEPSTTRTEGRPKVCNGTKKKQKDSQPNQGIPEMFEDAAQKTLQTNTDDINLD